MGTKKQFEKIISTFLCKVHFESGIVTFDCLAKDKSFKIGAEYTNDSIP
jgi:hypothetical protein